jgi:hypothetical protein
VKGLLDRTVQPCLSCMKDAGVQPADIQEVLLVGGMTRMPKVRSGVGGFDVLAGGDRVWSSEFVSGQLPGIGGGCEKGGQVIPQPAPSLFPLCLSPAPGPRDGARHLQEGAQPVDEPRRGGRQAGARALLGPADVAGMVILILRMRPLSLRDRLRLCCSGTPYIAASRLFAPVFPKPPSGPRPPAPPTAPPPPSLSRSWPWAPPSRAACCGAT